MKTENHQIARQSLALPLPHALRLVQLRPGLEEVHRGLTPEEQRRVFSDFAWIWGPPEDHFAHLLRSLGAERFLYGTHWPLRLVQNPRANLDLL